MSKTPENVGLNDTLAKNHARLAHDLARKRLMFVGNAGTGKTHWATALAIEAGGRGKRVRFRRVTERITQLREAREERTRTRRTGPLGVKQK